MADRLDDQTIERWLAEHPGWQREGDVLVRTVQCPSFPAAVEVVRRVADAAEERDHHPDIDIRYRTLRFALSTHSAGGITALDLDLGDVVERLAAGG